MLTKLLRQLLGRNSRGDNESSGHVGAPASAQREAMLEHALRLFRQGDHAALIAHCRAYLKAHPNDPDFLQFLATALISSGDLASGTQTLRHAARVNPEHSQIQHAFTRVLLKAGAVEEAMATWARAATVGEPLKSTGMELAGALAQLGRYDEAERILRTNLSLSPADPAEQHQLARVLFEQGRVEETLDLLRGLVDATAVDPAVHSDLLRVMNYSDACTPEAICREHLRWDERHAAPLAPATVSHGNRKAIDGRLRIGFVSPYFRKHAVTFFLESVIAELCTSVEVFLYADVAQQDEYSARLRAFGAIWRDTVKLDDEALATLVRSDAVDILIDLSGHTPRNRLLAFARRPAPVQITWNGYPNTTGMRAMDYRITDAYCDPPGTTEGLHRERLLRLPNVFMSWQPPRDAPDASDLPAQRNGYVTFASFNACYKLTPTTLAIWARILIAQPSARLLLATVPSGIAQQRIERAFAAEGVDIARLDFRSRVDHEAFLRMHAEADIALDPYPYHGTTTTCFSLWMGVPVVSLAGRSPASRVGVTLLSNAGLSRLVARDTDHYLQIALDLAADRDALANLRSGLRGRLQASPLTDGSACARALTSMFRQAWRAWCEQ